MKTIYRIVAGFFVLAIVLISTLACSSKKGVYTDATDEILIEKSGAQLWGETCNRCHLAPSPSAYNDTDWETIALHMRVRANLTENEINKIKEFLKSAN